MLHKKRLYFSLLQTEKILSSGTKPRPVPDPSFHSRSLFQPFSFGLLRIATKHVRRNFHFKAAHQTKSLLNTKNPGRSSSRNWTRSSSPRGHGRQSFSAIRSSTRKRANTVRTSMLSAVIRSRGANTAKSPNSTYPARNRLARSWMPSPAGSRTLDAHPCPNAFRRPRDGFFLFSDGHRPCGRLVFSHRDAVYGRRHACA